MHQPPLDARRGRRVGPGLFALRRAADAILVLVAVAAAVQPVAVQGARLRTSDYDGGGRG